MFSLLFSTVRCRLKLMTSSLSHQEIEKLSYSSTGGGDAAGGGNAAGGETEGGGTEGLYGELRTDRGAVF